MSDHDDEAPLLEPEPTDDELRAAEALRAALEQSGDADPLRAALEQNHDAESRAGGELDRAMLETALRARATAGRAAPLREATRRAAVEDALHATPRRAALRRGGRLWLAAALLLVAFVGGAITLRFVGEPEAVVARNLPDDGYARPTDALFRGGLQPEQRASSRLDAIVTSRTRGYFAVVAADLAARGEQR